MSSSVSAADLDVVKSQLGREPRGVIAIAARCACGNPTVVTTAPRLDDGTPFPTLYYLTHPGAVAAASRLEATGAMVSMNQRLSDEPALAAAYAAAHRAYLSARAAVGDVSEIDGVGAGGMPNRVKCLHVLVAHSLASGPGLNPLGDQALELMMADWRPDRCTCAAPAPRVDALP